MKRVVVVGSGGMLGREVVRECRQLSQKTPGLQLIGLDHAQLDITDQDAFRTSMESYKPDVVINCAGIVKSRQKDEGLMIDVNTIAPHKMADVCDEQGIRFVQISTDCVFAGDGPHIEADNPNERGVYGHTKALGEIHRAPHLTIRCSFVGLGARGLLHWLHEQKGEVEGHINVQWNGLTSRTAARAIVGMAMAPGITGIRHLFGADTNKYEVLMAANRALELGLDIKPVFIPVADNRLRTKYEVGQKFLPLDQQIGGLLSC